MTILFVDDHHSGRTVFAEVLRKADHTVLEAATLADAEHVVARHRGHIDLLIVEAVLTTGNGREVAERIAATHPEVGVLYVSEQQPKDLWAEGLLPPAAPFLHKPFAADDLIRKLHDATRLRQRAAG